MHFSDERLGAIIIGSGTILVAMVLALSAAHADIRIGRDLGGNVRDYQARVWSLHHSGERVRIDGVCASGCTLHLNLPRHQICATERATFVFHSATDAQFGLPNWRVNEELMNAYPPHVRLAIGQRGGLWLKSFSIKGTALAPRCKR